MRHRSQFSEKERHCISKLISLLHQGHLLKATTYVLHNTCGKPNCRCATGKKHETPYVARSKDGKRQARSVPKALRATVDDWVNRYKEIDDLINQLSDESWQKLEKKPKGPDAR